MPNTFLGFPVPRARIADMIDTATAGLVESADIRIESLIDASDCFTVTNTGLSVVTEARTGITLTSGIVLNDSSEVRKDFYSNDPLLTWDKNRTVSYDVDFSFSDGNNAEFHIVNGIIGALGHVGFKYDNVQLYGVWRGALGQQSTVLTDGGFPFSYTSYTLKFVFTAATKIEFYVDGTLRGTATTGIPTGTTNTGVIINGRAKCLTAGWRAAMEITKYFINQAA